MTSVVEIAAGDAAAPRVGALLAPTPLQHSPVLSELFGAPVHLKCEHVQPTGSFKVRGAAAVNAAVPRVGALLAPTPLQHSPVLSSSSAPRSTSSASTCSPPGRSRCAGRPTR